MMPGPAWTAALGGPTFWNGLQPDVWCSDQQGYIHRSGRQQVGGLVHINSLPLLLRHIRPPVVIATEHFSLPLPWRTTPLSAEGVMHRACEKFPLEPFPDTSHYSGITVLLVPPSEECPSNERSCLQPHHHVP